MDMQNALLCGVMVLLIAGCANEEIPRAEPVKLFVDATSTTEFINTTNANTVKYNEVYQSDINANGGIDADDPDETSMWIDVGAEAKRVLLDATYGTDWSIMVGGVECINTKWFNDAADKLTSVQTKKSFTIQPACIEFYWLVVDGGKAKWLTNVASPIPYEAIGIIVRYAGIHYLFEVPQIKYMFDGWATPSTADWCN
jgi:hypothetical protein